MSKDPAKRLGKYTILGEIGRGGFGTVYRVKNTSLGGRIEALKVLHPQLTRDPSSTILFSKEAGTVARLEHPQIVTIYEAGTFEGVRYIAMRYLPGASLAEVIAEKGQQPVRKAIVWLGQAASAIDYAHEHGVIHRDLKPGNLLLNANGAAMVTDFGLARAAEVSGGVVSSGESDRSIMTGTARYMAPEQARHGEATAQSDVYSLGVVAYELLAGRVPFEKGDAFAIAYQHIHEPPPPLQRFRPDIPEQLDQAVLKALEKNPKDRYQSAGRLVQALHQATSNAKAEARLQRELRAKYERLLELERAGGWTDVIELGQDIERQRAGYEDVEPRIDAAQQRLDEQQRGVRLAELYASFRAAEKQKNWLLVISLGKKLDTAGPGYRDVGKRLARAHDKHQRQAEAEADAQRKERERLERERMAALYDEARQNVDMDPQRTLDLVEQIRADDEGYPNLTRLEKRAQGTLIAREEDRQRRELKKQAEAALSAEEWTLAEELAEKLSDVGKTGKSWAREIQKSASTGRKEEESRSRDEKQELLLKRSEAALAAGKWAIALSLADEMAKLGVKGWWWAQQIRWQESRKRTAREKEVRQNRHDRLREEAEVALADQKWEVVLSLAVDLEEIGSSGRRTARDIRKRADRGRTEEERAARDDVRDGLQSRAEAALRAGQWFGALGLANELEEMGRDSRPLARQIQRQVKRGLVEQEKEKEEKKRTGLLHQAEAAVKAGQWATAQILADELDKLGREEKRQAKAIRKQAKRGLRDEGTAKPEGVDEGKLPTSQKRKAAYLWLLVVLIVGIPLLVVGGYVLYNALFPPSPPTVTFRISPTATATQPAQVSSTPTAALGGATATPPHNTPSLLPTRTPVGEPGPRRRTATPTRVRRSPTPSPQQWYWNDHGPFDIKSGAIAIVNYANTTLSGNVIGREKGGNYTFTVGSEPESVWVIEVSPQSFEVWAKVPNADRSQIEGSNRTSGLAAIEGNVLVIPIDRKPPDQGGQAKTAGDGVYYVKGSTQ